MEIKTIQIKQVLIGGPTPLIAFPMVGQSISELMEEAVTVLAQCPDLVEWRADFFENADQADNVLDALRTLRTVLGAYPLIFTLRDFSEGGFRDLSPAIRLNVIRAVVESGLIDLLDVEAANDFGFLEVVRVITKRHGVALILSSHNFKTTPTQSQMVSQLINMQSLNADIAKLCVMPTSREDVLNLMLAAYQFNDCHAVIPMIAISMSGDGLISRISGGIFGSSVTFCAGKNISAPGQIPANEMRTVLSLLEKHAIKKPASL